MILRVMRFIGGGGERRWPPTVSGRVLRQAFRGVLRVGVAAGVLIALLGAAGEAQAQLTPLQKQEMKQHYERATRAYDVQKYNEAVEEYQKAYEIGGDPAMLYNVAQSYRLADQLPDALRFYRRYLQRSPNARNREDVERKIADLEKTIEDRRKAAAAAAPPVVAAPPPVVVAPSPSPPPIIQDDGNPGMRIAGIVAASVGGAALITAAITGRLAAGKGDKITNASNNDGTFEPSWESSGKNLDKVTIISAIAGGALAVTGVILILAGGSGSTESAASSTPQAVVTPVIGGGTMGAAATLRF